MASSGGLLSLKWNQHKSTFLNSLAHIKQKELYSDITLACDGKYYEAHRLVLSTCSEYFEGMFERTPRGKHPIVVLKDISSEDLESLLSYMYDGEVNVLQENLSCLIKAAECLKIKGLAVPDTDPKEQREKSHSSSRSNRNYVNNSNNSHGDNSSRASKVSTPNSSKRSSYPSSNVNKQLEDVQPNKKRKYDLVNDSDRSPSIDRKKEISSDQDAPGGDPADSDSNTMPSANDLEDSRSYSQDQPDDIGVKSEPIEVIDDCEEINDHSEDRTDYDGGGDGETEFIEEKFTQQDDDPNSLWSNLGDSNDMYGQPSTSFPNNDIDKSASSSAPMPTCPNVAPDFTPELVWSEGPSLNSINNLNVCNATDPTTSQTMNHCPSCNYKTDKRANYQKHLRRHKGDKRFACNFCEKRFVAKYDRDRHEKIHTGEGLIHCDFCSYKCIQSRDLKAHMAKNHKTNTRAPLP